MSTIPNAVSLARDSWQLKVLPFMTRAIASMGVLFFLSSFIQIQLMRVELSMEPQVATERFSLESFDGPTKADLLRWNALIALERESLRGRTQATNAVILRQASLLHLGFLTGTVLCLVGAVFVLGRLQEPLTSLSGHSQSINVALNTSSPGIVLAFLGAGLICATLFHRYQFNLPDQTAYIAPESQAIPRLRRSMAEETTVDPSPAMRSGAQSVESTNTPSDH